MKERIQYYDQLRALAIIAVIAIHVSDTGYKYEQNSFNFYFTIVWRQLVNFSVPLFIAISGFFLANKDLGSFYKYRTFITKQIPRVLIPFFIWSIVYLTILYFRGTPISQLVFKLFAFQASGPFYFVLLICEFYILLPLLQRFSNRRGLIIALIISLTSSLSISAIKLFTHLNLPVVVSGSLPSFLVFFIFGLYIKNNRLTLSMFWVTFFAFVSLCLSILETQFLFNSLNNIRQGTTAIKTSSFLYSFFIIYLVFKNKRRFSLKFFSFVGELSFGIFLTHMLFLKELAIPILAYFPIISTCAVAYQGLLIILTILFSISLAILMRKLNHTFAIRYLGQ